MVDRLLSCADDVVLQHGYVRFYYRNAPHDLPHGYGSQLTLDGYCVVSVRQEQFIADCLSEICNDKVKAAWSRIDRLFHFEYPKVPF